MAQVEHETLHALHLELAQRLLQVARGRLAKLRQSHVADLVCADGEIALVVDVLDGGDLDQRPLEGDLDVLAGGWPEECHLDFGSRLAAQLVDRLRHGDVAGVLALDFHDAVARHDAGLVGRGILHRGEHGEVAVLNVDVHADTAELAFGIVHEMRIPGRRHELAVRVEHADHAPQRAVHEVLVRQLVAIDVILADALEHVDEQVEVGVGIVGGRVGVGLGVNLGPDRQVQQKQPEHHAMNDFPCSLGLKHCPATIRRSGPLGQA